MSASAAALSTALPVFVDPVNITQSTFAIRAAPVEPSPVATWKTPSGRPHSTIISSSRSELSGVTSLGLRITLLPAASAGMQSPKELAIGLFHDGTRSSARYFGACLAQKPSAETV